MAATVDDYLRLAPGAATAAERAAAAARVLPPPGVRSLGAASQADLVDHVLAHAVGTRGAIDADGGSGVAPAPQEMELLKELSRLPDGSRAMTSPENLLRLLALLPPLEADRPLATDSLDVADAALRCINNALFQNEASRATFASPAVRGGHAALRLVGLASSRPSTVNLVFLASRLVFFSTLFESDFNRTAVEELDAVDVYARALGALRRWRSTGATSPGQVDTAVTEALKALFNITLYYPRIHAREAAPDGGQDERASVGGAWSSRLDALVEPVIALLRTYSTTANARPPDQVLASPTSNVVAVLLNCPAVKFREALLSTAALDEGLDEGTEATATSPPPPQPCAVAALLELLDRACAAYLSSSSSSSGDDDDGDVDDDARLRHLRAKGIDVDERLRPLLLLLRGMAAEDEVLRDVLKRHVLPADIDRSVGLDKRHDTTGRLVRLMSSATMPHLATSAGELLLALCGGEASAMTREIGYGPCAGFLMNSGLTSAGLAGAATAQAQQRQGSGDGAQERAVDPITGAYAAGSPGGGAAEAGQLQQQQRRRDEVETDMTPEEKEREAERLVVLLDRLNATGVVRVADPREALAGEGEARELGNGDEDGGRQGGRIEEIEERVRREELEEEERQEREGMEELARYKEKVERRRQGAE